jgi:hypothetical protein
MLAASAERSRLTDWSSATPVVLYLSGSQALTTAVNLIGPAGGQAGDSW